MDIERRTYDLIELRAEEGEGKPLRIRGHAAVFNKKSDVIFGFREIVLPGAFAKSIKKDDIRALWNHDPNFVLGRNKSGTLKLKEDDRGLLSDIELPDTETARSLYASIKRGDVDQMSFGFRTITDNWRKDGGDTVRELVEVDLFDVSPVTYPAYPQTDVSARSFFEARMAALNPPPDPETALYRLKLLRRRLELKAKAQAGGFHG